MANPGTAEAQTTRVSVASDGTQGNGFSLAPALSDDGRFVAFASAASNLVPGDTNFSTDIFVHDRQAGRTTRVSVASDGTQGNNGSFNSTLSADGRFVAFRSSASNLVAGDTNNFDDVFVHDRLDGETTRVSVASDGTQGNGLSALFSSPALSADGRFVAFESDASNLVPGDRNGFVDIFVHDRSTRQTTLVSEATDGTQGNRGSTEPALSADGRFVAFRSDASNLVPRGSGGVFVHDRVARRTTLVSVASDGKAAKLTSAAPAVSGDGLVVAFMSLAFDLVPDDGDTNGTFDIFVRDRGQTTRVSVRSGGTEAANGRSASPALGVDGRFVAFESRASNQRRHAGKRAQ